MKEEEIKEFRAKEKTRHGNRKKNMTEEEKEAAKIKKVNK